MTNKTLPTNILARWNAADWNDEKMIASTYRYEDLQTGESIELSESEAAMYSWGQTEDNITGGSQRGELRG